MASTSFAKSGAATAAVPVSAEIKNVTPPAAAPVEANAEVVTEPVPVNQNTPAVATQSHPPAYADSADDVDSGDLQFPRISIVQKVGELSNVFPGGAIVLSKSAVLYEPAEKLPDGTVKKAGTAPLDLVVVGFRPKRYTEKVKGGALGRQVDTVEQVIAAGGTISYDESKASEGSAKFKPLFEQTEEALVLVRRPAHLEQDTVNFPFQLTDGSAWAAALWSMKGTAFTHAARPIMTARKIGALRDPRGYSDGNWQVTTILKSHAGNWYHQAVVKLSPIWTSPELKEMAALIRG